MAFNFNWSPLIADTSRARDMLTTALNKSPKPPIIVGDILVTELNLGSVPPELEILEIGDLAEDRFRGIFKMSYTGDAYLTLKTRVQANPLNTYLSSKPTFASPEPLAASSGLTIPLQITLSDIRLSGFVILVFSKQKGITLVFRNDPVESLKVSSTFDSIPFVRDYLQKEIEGQLRELFMEDLPAIIHRLSLRLWSPDHQEKQVTNGEEASTPPNEHDNSALPANSQQDPIDPLSSPPQDPFDEFGRPLDDDDFSLLDPSSEAKAHMKFSQKNLLRLAALTESYSTLSLFTPSMRDVVFRAWAGAAERAAEGVISPGLVHSSLTLASLSRMQHGSSASLASSTYTPSETSSSPYASRRTSVVGGLTSVRSTTSISSGRYHRSSGHKRKHRVVNLRKKSKADAANEDNNAEAHCQGDSRPTTPISTSSPSSHHHSSSSGSASVSQPDTQQDYYYRSIVREGELETPPASPEKTMKTPVQHDAVSNYNHDTIRPPKSSKKLSEIVRPGSNDDATPRRHAHLKPQAAPGLSSQETHRHERPSMTSYPPFHGSGSGAHPGNISAAQGTPSGGSILEQAWMLKMATEIARKVAEERAAQDATTKTAGGNPAAVASPAADSNLKTLTPSPLRDWGFWDHNQHYSPYAFGAISGGSSSSSNSTAAASRASDDGTREKRHRDVDLASLHEQELPPPPAYAA